MLAVPEKKEEKKEKIPTVAEVLDEAKKKQLISPESKEDKKEEKKELEQKKTALQNLTYDVKKKILDSPEITEEEKKRLLSLSEVSLSLDTYDDIFSDFDPRPYSQRVLSDDFLSEAKKASKDKASGNIELNFMIPTNQVNTYHESIIKKRLREHFKKHYALLTTEKRKVIRIGLSFAGVGILLMFMASFIMFKFTGESFLMNFLVVLLEPAGWFLFWSGMDQVIFKAKETNPDLEFYGKMVNCQVSFLHY